MSNTLFSLPEKKMIIIKAESPNYASTHDKTPQSSILLDDRYDSNKYRLRKMNSTLVHLKYD